jgi:hypothetical protein
MVLGTAFTLFVVPSIYTLVARTRQAAASPEASPLRADADALEAAAK